MEKVFPTMLDRPETHTVISGLFYYFFAFVSLPFILLLLMQGSFSNLSVMTGVETAFHVINFVVVVLIFREYLMDSFSVFRSDVRNVLPAVGIAVSLMVIIGFMSNTVAGVLLIPDLSMAAASMLPLPEMELFLLCGDLVRLSPLWGLLCMVVLVPVTASCMYYAISFAPICEQRPWLAYLAVALLIAVPRFCNGATYWDPHQELVLYLAQLPLHLIACWSYQKSDTVWAPILTLSCTNLIASVLILLA